MSKRLSTVLKLYRIYRKARHYSRRQALVQAWRLTA